MTLDGVKKTVQLVAPICVCRYRYFSKHQRLTAAGISDLMAKIHLSCRLEDREPGHRRVFLPRNCKLEKALKTVKSSIQDITEERKMNANSLCMH